MKIAYNVHAHTVNNELIYKAFQEAQEIIFEAGVHENSLGTIIYFDHDGAPLTIEDSPRMKKTLGLAIYPYSRYCNYQNKGFIIRLQRGLLDEQYYTDLLHVLIHEMIHCYFPKDGHRGMFEVAAKRINAYRPDVNITKIYRNEEHGYQSEQKPKEKKYAIQCPKCGKTWEYERRGQSVIHPDWYHCTHCKEKLVRIR